MYHRKKASDPRSAFTLVEILVAAAITIIMIGLVIQITSEVLKVWNRSVGKLSANAEARIAMELLTSDLETALLINNGQQWLRVETETTVGSPIAGQTVGLKLFSPALDRPKFLADGETPEAGNICAISYKLAYDQAYDNAKDKSFVLFRALEGPTDTFNELLGSGDTGPQLSLAGVDFWESTVSSENYLAGNIVDFKIYIYGIDDTTGEEIIINDTDENGEIDDNYFYGGNDSSDQTPIFAEIFLTVVSDDGLKILNLPSLSGTGIQDFNGDGSIDSLDVVFQQGEVFKRRVYFQARPL